MATRRTAFHLPGTVPGAHRRNVVVLLGYLLVVVLLAGLFSALASGLT